MELILWRHAEAEDANPKGDAARELTKRGRRQAQAMAAWLRPRLEGEWRVIASPAARAVQTVAALGREFEVLPALDTSANAASVLRAAGWPGAGRVIVVGHQPTLGEVAAILMDGGEGGLAVRKGAVWWFATRERDGATQAVLRAVLNPELLEPRGMGAK
jgi:phosphohistidine phosphatase